MIPTVEIGHGSRTVRLGKVAHGLMAMTGMPSPVPDEQCFEAIRASLDMVPKGSKMLLNSAEFYGFESRTANLELLARFFEMFPGYKEKAFLSVKGGTRVDSLDPDSSPENLKRSVDCILEKLRGTKKLDMFQCARVDRNLPIEEVTKVLASFVEEGKFDYIGMSECKAETLLRGFAVHPIALVEIEVSPWSFDEEVQKGQSLRENGLGVGIVAYSPLGRGFLAGMFESVKDLPDGDGRKTLDRFSEEYIESNKAIADGIKAIAASKSITAAQLCIAWVGALGAKVIPLPGSSKAARTKENTSAANIRLAPEDIEAVKSVLKSNPVKGGRYWAGSDADNYLWG